MRGNVKVKQLSDIQTRKIPVIIEADISCEDWQQFNKALTREQARRYLSDMVGELIKELLYANPAVLAAYSASRPRI